jgi:hypothetical protein
MQLRTHTLFTDSQTYDSIYGGIYSGNIIFVDEVDEEYEVDDESEESDEDDFGYVPEREGWSEGIPGQDIVNDEIMTIIDSHDGDAAPRDRAPHYISNDSETAEA